MRQNLLGTTALTAAEKLFLRRPVSEPFSKKEQEDHYGRGRPGTQERHARKPDTADSTARQRAATDTKEPETKD